jgi:CRP-like cAMP-binding protein
MEVFIKNLEAICPISDDLKKYIRVNLKEKRIEKKGFILKAGRTARHISFIEKGLVRCFYMKEDTDISIWFMKEGDVFVSVASFFDQKAGVENIQALEDTVMYSMGYDELQVMYQTFPEANFVGRVLTEKYYKLSEERLTSLRMQKAPERYQFLKVNYPELIRRVASKYLASYLGITTVMLSYIRGKKKLG